MCLTVSAAKPACRLRRKGLLAYSISAIAACAALCHTIVTCHMSAHTPSLLAARALQTTSLVRTGASGFAINLHSCSHNDTYRNLPSHPSAIFCQPAAFTQMLTKWQPPVQHKSKLLQAAAQTQMATGTGHQNKPAHASQLPASFQHASGQGKDDAAVDMPQKGK